MTEAFTITWNRGAYYVSIPDYRGGVVYPAAEVDRLERANAELKAALVQFVAACDTAPPASFVIEIGMACKAAKEALAKVKP